MQHLKCNTCGNSYHWSHAFAKFGYDDGDGNIKTPDIAEALEFAGYYVKYSRWFMHNELIYSIKKDNIELMPVDNPNYRIGYDDPQKYLPGEVLDLLDAEFPRVRLFH